MVDSPLETTPSLTLPRSTGGGNKGEAPVPVFILSG
jgi:hypothetical protein